MHGAYGITLHAPARIVHPDIEAMSITSKSFWQGSDRHGLTRERMSRTRASRAKKSEIHYLLVNQLFCCPDQSARDIVFDCKVSLHLWDAVECFFFASH